MLKFSVFARLVILCTASLHANCVLLAEEQSDSSDSERIELTPDFPQNQKALPGNGGQYCAPVSASNGLAWLAKDGYPKLMPTNQVDLARELGSPTFMKTSLKNGTGIKGVTRGLANYVTNSGYSIKELAYQGWRSADKRLVRRIPGHSNPLRIGHGLRKKSIVLLNVGFYKKRGSEYERRGGHWVTLVGSEKGDTPILIVHDPARRSPEGQHERVTATRIRTGKLVGSQAGLPIAARGAWELGGELKLQTRKGADTAILDGAILLRLK